MSKDRVFNTKDKDGNDLVLKFKRPSQKVLTKAELVRRTAFSNALRNGLILQEEAKKIIKERGLWNDDHEKEAENTRARIGELEKKLEDASLTNEQGKALCDELTKQRDELISHNMVFTSITENTCESVAGEEKNQFLAAECTYDNKTDLRVFKDVEDFKSRLDEQLTLDSYREAVIAALETVSGRDLPSDLTSEYAENKWIKSRGLDKEEAEESEEKAS